MGAFASSPAPVPVAPFPVVNHAGASLTVNILGTAQAGGQAFGVVFLLVTTSSIDASALQVEFSGTEHSQVHYTTLSTDSEGNSKIDHHLVYGRQKIFNVVYQLAAFAGETIAAGKYVFPFVFNVPSTLPVRPESDTVKGPDRSFFFINYYVETMLVHGGRPVVATGRQIDIAPANPPSDPTPSFLAPVCQPVHWCGCYRKGSVLLFANLANTHVVMGKPAELQYVLRNMSSLKVRGLEILVEEVEKCVTVGKSEINCRVVFSAVVKVSELPGFTNAGRSDGAYEPLMAEIQRQVASLPINVLRGYGSIQTPLGNITHTMVVRVIMSGCVRGVQLEFPITLHKPSAASTQPPTTAQLPVGWENAIVTPVVDLNPQVVPAPVVAVAAVASTPAPTAAAVGVVAASEGSVTALESRLKSVSGSTAEVTEVHEWLQRGGDVGELLADARKMTSVFRHVRSEEGVRRVPQQIGSACAQQRRVLEMHHVVAAAAGVDTSREDDRVQVLTSFAPFVSDKVNAKAALAGSGLSEYATMKVLMAIRS